MGDVFAKNANSCAGFGSSNLLACSKLLQANNSSLYLCRWCLAENGIANRNRSRSNLTRKDSSAPGYRKDILNNYFKHIAAERSNSAAPTPVRHVCYTSFLNCADGAHALLSFFPAQTIIPDLRFAFQK